MGSVHESLIVCWTLAIVKNNLWYLCESTTFTSVSGCVDTEVVKC